MINVTKWQTGINLTSLENDLQYVSSGVVVRRCPDSIEENLNQSLEQASLNEPPIVELPENENIIQKQMSILAISIDNFTAVKQKEIDLRERELQFKIEKMNLTFSEIENSEESE